MRALTARPDYSRVEAAAKPQTPRAVPAAARPARAAQRPAWGPAVIVAAEESRESRRLQARRAYGARANASAARLAGGAVDFSI